MEVKGRYPVSAQQRPKSSMSVEGLDEEPSRKILAFLYVRQHTHKWGEKGRYLVLHNTR